MAAGSHQDQLVGKEFVEEQPIRLDVTIPVPLPFTTQWMNPASFRERLVGLQKIHDGLQFVDIFALLLNSAEISFKRAGGEQFADIHWLSRSSRKER